MRTAVFICLAASVLASAARAEQQLTLKSGATIVGDAKFDGDAVLIDVDGAATRIPFADIATVAPANYSERQQAQQLLLRALEARLAGTAPKDAVVLLAEAAQLDPENPHVAYWFATTLVEAGYGKIARTKFENQRAAIEEAYPDGTARLVRAIERRVAIEALPPDLVVRIDEFNAEAAAGKLDENNPHMKRMAGVFRVLDQYNDPIEQSAIQVQANGGQERLEQFTDGYFFYFMLNGNNEDTQECRVVVSQSGLKQGDHQFTASRREALMGREFVVHRFADADKRPARVLIAGPDGEPLAGINVQLQPSQGNAPALTATTDAEGLASFTAFPGQYGLYATGDGYNAQRGQLQLDEQNAQGAEQRLVLHRAITGSVRLEWRTKSWQNAGETTEGSTIIQMTTLDGGGGYYGESVSQAFRLGQVEDKLMLQITQYNYGGPPAAGPPVKRLKLGDDVPASDRKERAIERFESLDLADFDQLGDEFVAAPTEPLPNYGPGSARIAIRLGDVIVGRTAGRDMRTGQPLEVTYKAYVESPEDAEDAADDAGDPAADARPRVVAPVVGPGGDQGQLAVPVPDPFG